jgi:hypothetical protein
LRWAGHVIRRGNEKIIKRIMLVKPEGEKERKKDQELGGWMVWRRIGGTRVLTGKQWHKSEMAGESF